MGFGDTFAIERAYSHVLWSNDSGHDAATKRAMLESIAIDYNFGILSTRRPTESDTSVRYEVSR